MNEKKNHRIIETLQGDPLKRGVTVKHGGVNFTMEIPEQEEAALLLYPKRKPAEPMEIPLPPEQRVGELSAVMLPDERVAQYAYQYKINGEMCLDPYAKEIRDGLCRIVRERFDWGGDKLPCYPYEETILYKLHIKGFTKQASSKVRARGTFAGVIEKIPYMQSLGITTLLCMPMYEWEETLKSPVLSMTTDYGVTGEPEIKKNFWGYAEKNYYFSPKAAFSHSKDAVQECKQMIRALHAAGLECVMEFYFPKGTNAMLALEALHYWKMEYHMDGFRLTGEGVPVDAIVHDPLLRQTKLLLDYVDGDWIYGDKIPAVKNLAEYNDGFCTDARRFLKGDEGQLASFAYRLRRNPATHGVINYVADNNGFTMADMVTYDHKHNEDNGEDNQDGNNQNYNWNCGVEGPSRKTNIRMLRKRQLKNAFLYVLLAQGTPMIQAGDEFGNSQKGNNNAYCQDNATGWVDWSEARKHEGLMEFVKEVITFRKQHPILHMQKELRIMDYKSLGVPDLSYHDDHAWHMNFDHSSRYMGVMYCGAYAQLEKKNADNMIYVAYNAYWEPHSFAVPKTPVDMHWYRALDTGTEEISEVTQAELETQEEQEKVIKKVIQVPPRTVVVLIGK